MRKLLAFTAFFFIFLMLRASGESPRGPLEEIVEKASEGDGAALYILATLHDRGFDTIPVDSVRSTELYRLAAEKGNVEAMNYLGFRLLSGEVSAIGRDADEGFQWLERAADAGDLKAASNIGWLFMEGKYLTRDYAEAAYWFDKAARGGLPIARSLLGDLYRDGLGMAPDSLKADSLYREAFESGLADAGYKLADLRKNHYSGLSSRALTQEGLYYYLRSAPSEGVKLFYEAMEKGDAKAMALLGDAYSRAIGVPYDHDLSMKYFLEAALAGDPSAEFVIGELLDIFPDALDSLEEAGLEIPSLSPTYWYEKAAESGVSDAEEATRRLLSEH